MRFHATTQEATQILRTSESTLRRLRKAGVLRPGIHFCVSSGGVKAPISFGLQKLCKKFLLNAPAKSSLHELPYSYCSLNSDTRV